MIGARDLCIHPDVESSGGSILNFFTRRQILFDNKFEGQGMNVMYVDVGIFLRCFKVYRIGEVMHVSPCQGAVYVRPDPRRYALRS